MIALNVYTTSGKVYTLELTPGVKVSLEELMPAFDRNLEQGLFSFPIEIPFTPNNMTFFNNLQNMNSLSSTIPEFWRCDLIEDGIAELVDAKLKLLNHKGRWDNTDGSFNGIITGAKGLFGSVIKGKTLRDLELGGLITWSSAMDSREFAKHVMDGNEPSIAERLAFIPVRMEDFFDETSDSYANEVIGNNIVNNIILNVGFSNGWIFGKNATINTKVNKGVATYEEYRTVPFLKLLFVLKQIALEHGYTLGGNFFTYPDLDKVTLFNNRAIEKYDVPFSLDVNTEIDPRNHVPEIRIVDFLIAIQNTFNLKVDFFTNNRIELNFNHKILVSSSVTDYTSNAVSIYDESVRHEAFENGYKLGWVYDSNDGLPSEKNKKLSELNVIATVTLYAEIAGLSFGFPLEDKHYILVTAENYFYNYNTSAATWKPVFENNDELQIAKGVEDIKPNVSTLCSCYAADGTRLNMVGTRQRGSYWSNTRALVTFEFGLRLFFSGKTTSGSYTDLPISFNHNYDAAGYKLASFSFNWHTPEGMYSLFYKVWLLMLMESWLIKAKLQLNRVNLSVFKSTDLLTINGTLFVKRKQAYTLPLNQPVTVELVKV